MKSLAIFGGAGMLTAVIAGSSVGIVLGNLALLAASVALLGTTLSLEKS